MAAAADTPVVDISIKIKTIDDRSYSIAVPYNCLISSLKEKIKVHKFESFSGPYYKVN